MGGAEGGEFGTQVIYDPAGMHIVKDNGLFYTVGPNFLAIDGFKLYEFDPNTGVLRLDAPRFVKGELEKKIGIHNREEGVTTVPIKFGELSTEVKGVREIKYVDEPMRVEFKKPFSLREVITSLFRR